MANSMVKYGSMVNARQHTIAETLADLIDKNTQDEPWVAVEKVDGANFQFAVDASKEIVCCSRNFILTEDRNFYNFQNIREKYRNSLLKAYDEVLTKYVEEENRVSAVIRIYGELFGGGYPDPPFDEESKKKTNMTKAVQDRIFYMDEIDFFLFDVIIKIEGQRNEKYLTVQEIIDLAETCNFPFVAKPLKTDVFRNLCKIDTDFNTTIPALVGLEPVENNKAEGYILRPLVNRSFQPRLKHKSPDFMEMMGVPRDRPEKVPKNSRLRSLPQEKQDKLAIAVNMIRCCMTKNRLGNISSHYEAEEFCELPIAELANLMITDSIKELHREKDPDFINNYNPRHFTRLKEETREDAEFVVKQHKGILDVDPIKE